MVAFFKEYVKLLQGHKHLRMALVQVWPTVRQMVGGKYRCSKVSNHLEAVVATASDLGFDMLTPLRWRDEEWTREMDPENPAIEEELQAYIKERVAKQKWKVAARHFGGGGLVDGPDLTVARQAIKEYKQSQ